jgi:hypothetical protein
MVVSASFLNGSSRLVHTPANRGLCFRNACDSVQTKRARTRTESGDSRRQSRRCTRRQTQAITAVSTAKRIGSRNSDSIRSCYIFCRFCILPSRLYFRPFL